jgi:cation/acetate symporter
MATIALGVLAIVLGIAFEKENVAYMVMLAFTVACSSNFPVLFMSVLWKNTPPAVPWSVASSAWFSLRS